MGSVPTIDEINRIAAAKQNIKTALETKGVEFNDEAIGVEGAPYTYEETDETITKGDIET